MFLLLSTLALAADTSSGAFLSGASPVSAGQVEVGATVGHVGFPRLCLFGDCGDTIDHAGLVGLEGAWAPTDRLQLRARVDGFAPLDDSALIPTEVGVASAAAAWTPLRGEHARLALTSHFAALGGDGQATGWVWLVGLGGELDRGPWTIYATTAGVGVSMPRTRTLERDGGTVSTSEAGVDGAEGTVRFAEPTSLLATEVGGRVVMAKGNSLRLGASGIGPVVGWRHDWAHTHVEAQVLGFPVVMGLTSVQVGGHW